VDRLFSLFSFYEFLGYVFTGAALIAGAAWAVAGAPTEPGAAAVVGLLIASYIAGHLVQALAVVWEVRWWRAGWPSDRRMTEGDSRAYSSELRTLVVDALAASRPPEVRKLEPRHLFALARADLRRMGADTRAELMNAMYAMSRGLATTSAVLAATFVVVGVARGADRMWPASIVAASAALLFLYRFTRFGYYFADQVWRDRVAFADGVGSLTGSGSTSGNDS